jgi:transcriptional regulator with GAF, ATPase, and Fis domain
VREHANNSKAGSKTVWTEAFGLPAQQLRDRVVPTLTDGGVEQVAIEHATPDRHGIVFIADDGDAACRFVEEVSRSNATCRVLVVTCGARTIDQPLVSRLLAAGSADVLTGDDPISTAAAVAARLARWSQVDELARSPAIAARLVGPSREWQRVLRKIVEIARYSEGAILIWGETGTGKELVARLVHQLDLARQRRELVLLDCATVVPTLSGSEFFGHERGAFTGAVATREGAFERADGGTLFLDEVGELPRSLQAELLRVVQEGSYKRVGGNTWRQTSFRLLCATNRNLRAEAEQGGFRDDFYHRIAAWTVRLPSLRERPGDILPLARHFLGELRAPGEPPEFDAFVSSNLLLRDYPGNVRDLRHLIRRIHDRHVGQGPVTIGDLDTEDLAGADASGEWFDGGFELGIRRALASGVSLKEIGSTAMDLAVVSAVSHEDGNLQRAARLLGVTPRALQLRRAAGRVSAVNGAHAVDC